MKILVTGGTGYIGSHTCIELIEQGYEILIVDNLSNSCVVVLDRMQELTGRQIRFFPVDLLDKRELAGIFSKYSIDAVIHFAGLKAVGESVEKPLLYYENNLSGTIQLLQVMQEYDVKKFVFSSSATVYEPRNDGTPIVEDFSLGPVNPYGRTKRMIEEILHDLCASDKDWSVALLRYFNPIGAHPSGRIGEDPKGIPNNLMPSITRVATGKLDYLRVFGNDYPTPDGTGIRDYIHVMDLARGHIQAVEKVKSTRGIDAYNLGTGKGYSVMEIIRTFEEVSGRKIPFIVTDRRPGDTAVCFADPSKANKELNWKAEKSLEEMCADAWRWQLNNPNGYQQV